MYYELPTHSLTHSLERCWMLVSSSATRSERAGSLCGAKLLLMELTAAALED